LIIAAAAFLSLSFAAGAAGDSSRALGRRVALVIGNAAYAPPQPAVPNALNDARDMAAALRREGFQVFEADDATLNVMRSSIGRFVGALRPDDIALVYYAGHGAQGRAIGAQEVNDDFLIPIDARLGSADALAREGVGLSEVLNALGAIRTQAQLIVLDACRDDPAAGASHALGLAWPDNTRARNAFIVFAASPGEVAGDPPSGTHGVFTGALLKAIDRPGVTVAELFAEVANEVELNSHPTQRPYFAGAGRAAGVVLAAGPKFDEPSDADLSLYREGMTCTQAACVAQAVVRVVAPRLKSTLLERRIALERLQPPATPQAPEAQPLLAHPRAVRTGSRREASRSTTPSPPRPPRGQTPLLGLDGLPRDVQAFIRANNGDAAGWLTIGRRFLTGAAGFPISLRQARVFLSAAAEAGSGAAAYDLATALKAQPHGAADPDAYAWFLRAARLGVADGWVGAAETTRLNNQGALLQQGVAAGSAEAMLRLGTRLKEGETSTRRPPGEEAPSLRLFRQAAALGSPGALVKIGECYRDGDCGLQKDARQAVDWFKRAAAKDDIYAFEDLAVAYLKGEGTPKNIPAAMVWLRKLGSQVRFGPTALARIYEKGLGGTPPDEQQAMVWYRKAAELADPLAALKLADLYDRHSWFNPTATLEARYWRRQAALLGWPRFGLKTLAFNLFARSAQEAFWAERGL